MADRALRFDLIGRDKSLGRTLGQGEARLRRFGSTAVKVGSLIGGAFAGIQVAGFLKDAITEAREAEKAGKQTAAVIKATGGVARVSAKDVEKLANALSLKAAVDDELIQSGANLLLTFRGVRNEAGKGNDVFNQASSAILDMTAAMNNGTISQEGLKASTIQVGKALGDPLKGLTALTRVGVIFTAAQRKQIKSLVDSGKTMEAQKVILGELKSEFGGAAAAAADPWQRFGVVMANIKEKIGLLLLPALTAVADFLSKNLPGAIDALVAGPLGRFVHQLRVTRDILRVIGPKAALKSLFPADLAPTIDAIATAVGKVAGRLTTAARTWATTIIAGVTEGLRNGNYGPLGKALADAVLAALGATGDLAARIGGWVRTQFGKVDWFQAGKDVGRQAFPFVIGFSATLVDGLITAAKQHPMDTVLFFASFLAVGKIGGVIGRLLAKIPFLRAFAPLFEGLNRLTRPLNDAIGRVLGSMGRAFLRGLGFESPRMGRALARSFDGLRLRIWSFRDGFGRAGLGLVEGAGRGVRRGLGSLGRSFAEVVGAVGRFLGRLLGPVAAPFTRAGSNLITRLAAGMRSAYGAVNTSVAGTITRLVSPFRSAGSWLVNAGRAVLSGLAAGIRAGLGGIGAVLSSVRDAIVGGIRRLFGIRSPSTVMAGLGAHMIGGLVRGLIASRGTLAAILRTIGKDVLGAASGVIGAIGGLVGGIGAAIVRGPVVGIVRGVAATRGWGSGAQWAALSQIISHESGWRPTAQNPTSSAYGLFQFLDSTWGSVGGHKTSNPLLQAIYGLRYIAGRYGSPVGAWAFWQAHHWYHAGGPITEPIFGVGASGRTYGFQSGETILPRGAGGITVTVPLTVYGSPTVAQEQRMRQVASEVGTQVGEQILRALRKRGSGR